MVHVTGWLNLRIKRKSVHCWSFSLSSIVLLVYCYTVLLSSFYNLQWRNKRCCTCWKDNRPANKVIKDFLPATSVAGCVIAVQPFIACVKLYVQGASNIYTSRPPYKSFGTEVFMHGCNGPKCRLSQRTNVCTAWMPQFTPVLMHMRDDIKGAFTKYGRLAPCLGIALRDNLYT